MSGIFQNIYPRPPPRLPVPAHFRLTIVTFLCSTTLQKIYTPLYPTGTHFAGFFYTNKTMLHKKLLRCCQTFYAPLVMVSL